MLPGDCERHATGTQRAPRHGASARTARTAAAIEGAIFRFSTGTWSPWYNYTLLLSYPSTYIISLRTGNVPVYLRWYEYGTSILT